MLTCLIVLALFAMNVATPGASFILTVSNAMSHGRKTGFLIAAGLATADAMFATAAIFGIAALVAGSPFIVRCISLLGGLWLFYGGVRLLVKGRNAHLVNEADSTYGALAPSLAFRMGFTTGALNAQAIIFFATMFVASLTQKPSAFEAGFLVTGVALVSLVVRCLIVRLFTVSAMQQKYSTHRRKAEALAGGALAFFGVKIATVPALAFLATS